MDAFREKQNDQCGPGGVGCHCCNPFKGNRNPRDQAKLNRIARTRLKRDDKKLEFTIDIAK